MSKCGLLEYIAPEHGVASLCCISILPWEASNHYCYYLSVFVGNNIKKSKELGSYLNERLQSAKSEFPDIITEIRGIGLWYAFDVNPKKITMTLVNEMQRRGVIVGSMLNSDGTIRIAPPLTIRPAEIDAFIGVLKASLRTIKG